MIYFISFVIILYILICLILYWQQERLIFHPTKIDPDYDFSQYENFDELFFPIEEGQINALYFKAKSPKGVVLYFHGNSEALESWGFESAPFLELGYDVLMPDYRGYGKSTGELSESALYEDAQMVFDYLKTKWTEDKIIIYGRSLGTGIATDLATKVHPKLLILETPFISMSLMAYNTIPIVPIKWLMRYQFRNAKKVKNLNCPVHIFAATRDELTPYKHAVILAKKAGNPETILTSIKGAQHGNISTFPDFHKKLKELLR